MNPLLLKAFQPRELSSSIVMNGCELCFTETFQLKTTLIWVELAEIRPLALESKTS